MFWFSKTKRRNNNNNNKKIDWPRVEPGPRQNIIDSGPLTTRLSLVPSKQQYERKYITCIGSNSERLNVTLRWLHCSGKQKVSFVFRSTKDLQKCARKTEFFCIRYFSKTKSKPAKENTGQCLLTKTKPHAKIETNPGKKNGPTFDIRRYASSPSTEIDCCPKCCFFFTSCWLLFTAYM